MKPITKIAAIATIHFGFTAGSLIGAVAVAANAVRDGFTEVGVFGEFLRESARLLAQPATTVVLSHLAKESIWMWPILLLNSVLWASVIVLAFRVLARKRNHAPPNTHFESDVLPFRCAPGQGAAQVGP